MEIVKCEQDNCKGTVCWDEEKEVFMCDTCGALYR